MGCGRSGVGDMSGTPALRGGGGFTESAARVGVGPTVDVGGGGVFVRVGGFLGIAVVNGSYVGDGAGRAGLNEQDEFKRVNNSR